MTSRRPPPAGFASQAESTAWEQDCLLRERREYFSALAAASVIFPAYSSIDVFLEPALFATFALWRAIGFAALLAACVGVRRAQTLTAARAWFMGAIGFAGAIVAGMMPSVGHFGAYLVGYSCFFWGTLLFSWPIAVAIPTFSWHLCTVVVAFLLASGSRTRADYLSAGLFLGAAAILASFSSYASHATRRREFLISRALADRNAELATALEQVRRAQAQLVAQEKLSALGRMLGGLSHEMNNPINVIKNNLEPVREHIDVLVELLNVARASDPDGNLEHRWVEDGVDWCVHDLGDALDAIKEAARRVQQVNLDLRAFIRGDAPGVTRANLNDGLRATVALLSRRLPEALTLALSLEDLPELCCQPGQLNQVWLNLVQNAIEASNGSGVVRVSSSRVGDHVEVSVADQGPGIAADFRTRLFEPFATTKDAGSGTGLGLATSYEIVKRHHGRIYLDESHAPGARFVVELPLEASRAGAALH